MSIAIVHPGLSASSTWRQFQAACWCALLAIGVGCAIYAVETLLLRSEHRFVENPADIMTRAIGLAHFSIGWLFLFTSPRLRNRAALSRLAFWTAFGVGFCALFALGGDKNPWLTIAFYSFFFIHEACDEAHLFRHSGELPRDTPGADRFLRALAWTMSFTFVAFLATGNLIRGVVLRRSDLLREIPSEWLLVGWLILTGAALVWMATTVRLARTLYGSLREAVGIYQPLFAVYAGLLIILIIGSMLGSIGPNLVILLHGMTWLVYSYRRLSESEAPVTGLWTWLRHSPVGFLTLHLVVIGVALVLFALRTHVWERTGFVCDLVSKTWFPYWSIMHIAMAFWRGK
jgi:hypothetical protein